MKLYAPGYYRRFVCIADRCRHSCCVGWEIDIDCDTAEKYAALTDGYGLVIKNSVLDGEGKPPCFAPTESGRCPHLSVSGLCNIITELGEGYLCEICREHPRFYHDTPSGREVGLALACEEACRIILGEERFDDFYELGEVESDGWSADFDPLSHRARIYSVLKDRSLTYAEKLDVISDSYGVSPRGLSDEDWRELLGSLEYLDESDRRLFALYSSESAPSEWMESALTRALAYFVFRHLSPARSESELCVALGFALFCERLLSSVAEKSGISCHGDLCELARLISEELEYSEENTETIKTEFAFMLG